MNKNIFQGEWNVIKGKIKQKWGDLTDDQLATIEGKNDEIFGALQKQYGYNQEEAQKQVDDFTNNL